MKKLYRFYRHFGRMGSIDGLFIAEEDDVNKTIGQPVYYGEILGKHSEVEFTLERKDLEAVTDDQDFIEKCERYIRSPHLSGYNPVARILEEDSYEVDDAYESA